MKACNYLILIVLYLTIPCVVCGQQVLTLQDCRQKALETNKSIAISKERVAAAQDLEKMALCEFFPKVSANGTYIWNQKSIQLLNDEQQTRINNMGTTAQENIVNNINAWIEEHSPIDLSMLESYLESIEPTSAAEDLNSVGRDITDALNFNTHHIFAGAISVTQPIYMGGKIRAFYKTARLANQLAEIQYDKTAEEQLVAVDEAYWRVISVQNKVELAQQYVELLTKLNNDVQAMVDAEVATSADLTRVRVKLNEAQMSLTKAENGLALSRMVLNQLCGLPLDQVYILVKDSTQLASQYVDSVAMDQVWANRKEIKMLEITQELAQVGVKVAISGLLPNIGVTGSYIISNPNLLNGYQRNFRGMFTVGVAVNIPICHADAFYAVKAAKHKRNEIQYQIEDARDKIQLQVNKLNYELQVSNRKLAQSISNLENAEENLRLADESFKSGLISTSELMQAQTAWLSAKSEVTDTEIEIQMDNVYLRQALGE